MELQPFFIIAVVVELTSDEIRVAVERALAEDIGAGDVTTLATIPKDCQARARLIAREPLVVAGLAFAEAAFRQLSASVNVGCGVRDSERVDQGASLATITGPARALLSAERVALNFLQRLSGIATLTAQYTQAIVGTGAKILDTRKTTPGWRRFEKYAVACGGGHNHRMGLYDLVLIKDNHLVALRHEPPHPIGAALRRAKVMYPQLQTEVEADTLEQVQQALEFGADIILLDNMGLDELRQAVFWVCHKVKTEASGGVNLQSVRAIAETGVDYISVGALTHSAPSVDIALDFE